MNVCNDMMNLAVCLPFCPTGSTAACSRLSLSFRAHVLLSVFSAAVCPQITCRPRRSVHLRRKTAAPWQLATPWPHVQKSSVEELAIVVWQPPAVAPTVPPTVPPPSDPPLPPGPPPPPLPPPSECACNGIQCCAALAEACYAKAAQRGRACKRALHYYCKKTCSKAGAGWFRFCGKSATSGCRAHAHNPWEAAVTLCHVDGSDLVA